MEISGNPGAARVSSPRGRAAEGRMEGPGAVYNCVPAGMLVCAMICLLKPDSRINPPSQQNESPAGMINHSKGKGCAGPSWPLSGAVLSGRLEAGVRWCPSLGQRCGDSVVTRAALCCREQAFVCQGDKAPVEPEDRFVASLLAICPGSQSTFHRLPHRSGVVRAQVRKLRLAEPRAASGSRYCHQSPPQPQIGCGHCLFHRKKPNTARFDYLPHAMRAGSDRAKS